MYLVFFGKGIIIKKKGMRCIKGGKEGERGGGGGRRL